MPLSRLTTIMAGLSIAGLVLGTSAFAVSHTLRNGNDRQAGSPYGDSAASEQRRERTRRTVDARRSDRTVSDPGRTHAHADAPGRRAAADTSAAERELLAADRSFARATSARGAEGWTSWFLEDGGMIGPGYRVQGRAAVRDAMRAAFARPGYQIEWEPAEAHPGPGSATGFTVGSYRILTGESGGVAVVERGRYVTLWRRDEAGRWRVRLDVGLPSPAGE